MNREKGASAICNNNQIVLTLKMGTINAQHTKKFSFPSSQWVPEQQHLELWVVTWFSFAKHNYPIVGCYWRLGRTLGNWDWCSLQPRAKMSQSGHLMARSLDNQMARCPDGQMSGWLDVRMARRTVGQKSLWLYGLYI